MAYQKPKLPTLESLGFKTNTQAWMLARELLSHPPTATFEASYLSDVIGTLSGGVLPVTIWRVKKAGLMIYNRRRCGNTRAMYSLSPPKELEYDPHHLGPRIIEAVESLSRYQALFAKDLGERLGSSGDSVVVTVRRLEAQGGLPTWFVRDRVHGYWNAELSEAA